MADFSIKDRMNSVQPPAAVLFCVPAYNLGYTLNYRFKASPELKM